MALTREQFDTLRAKGLTVEQIIKFENNNTPKETLSGQFNKRAGNLKEAINRQSKGEQGVLDTTKTAIGETAGFVNDVFGKAVQGVDEATPEFIKNIPRALTPDVIEKPVTDTVSNVSTKINDYINNLEKTDPKRAQAVKDTTNILSMLLFTKGLNKGVETGADIIKPTLKTIKESGTEAVGKTIATAGAITEKTGKKAVSVLFPPNDSQIAKLTSYKAKNPLTSRISQSAKGIETQPITPSQVALKYNLIGVSRTEIAAKAKRITDQLWKKQVNPALDQIKDKITKNEIFSEIGKRIDDLKDISSRKSLQNALESLADDYKHVASWNVKTLDKIKSEMSKKLPTKVWKGQDIAGDLNNIRKMFSDIARDKVRTKLPSTIKQIYDEYGSLLEIMKVGNKAYKQGSFGSGWLGATSELLRVAGTPIVTVGGKILDQTGKALKSIGQKIQK